MILLANLTVMSGKVKIDCLLLLRSGAALYNRDLFYLLNLYKLQIILMNCISTVHYIKNCYLKLEVLWLIPY